MVPPNSKLIMIEYLAKWNNTFPDTKAHVRFRPYIEGEKTILVPEALNILGQNGFVSTRLPRCDFGMRVSTTWYHSSLGHVKDVPFIAIECTTNWEHDVYNTCWKLARILAHQPEIQVAEDLQQYESSFDS